MEKNIHVLYIITKLELGGAQKVCLSLFHGLKGHGIATTLISGAQGVLASGEQNNPTAILLDSFKREVGFRSIYAELKTFITLWRIIRRYKKGHQHLVVHTHSTKAGLMGRWAAFFAGVHTRMHTVHGFCFNDYQPWWKWLIIWSLEWITSLVTTRYVCVSQKDLEEGARRLPFFRKKSSVIRAAVSFEKFYLSAQKTTIVPDAEQFIFGCVSCFKPQKNLFDLLNAFACLYGTVHEKSNVHLQLIGDGVLRDSIEQWIADHDLTHAITLLGWQNDVARWMRQWQALVMSSLWEGLPCTVVEARLLRLPVIAYGVGGIPEVIFDGKNGFVVMPGDWQGLSEKMEVVFSNKDVMEKMRSYNDTLDSFDNAFMLHAHAQLYRTVF